MKKVKLWAGLLILFISGVATGAVGSWVIAERHTMDMLSRGRFEFHRIVAKKLTRELGLDEVQRERITGILCQTHKEMRELRRRHRPEADQIMQRGIDSMKAGLSPEQQTKLDAFYERERGRWHHGGGPAAGKHRREREPCD
ncbi:MAG: hypothetical protein AB2L11_00345 [Syntrophobacteraceae bacterium]